MILDSRPKINAVGNQW